MLDQETYTEIARLKRQVERLSGAEAYKLQGVTPTTDNLYKGKLFFRQDLGLWAYYEPAYADGGLFKGLTGGWYEAGKSVSDTFTRADSATVLGSTNNNIAWVPQAGTWGISSNKAHNGFTDTDDDAVLLETYINNPVLQVVVQGKINGAGNNRIPGLAFRGLNNSNYLLVHLVAGNVQLFVKAGGGFTNVANAATTTNDATDYTITVVCNGLLITVYVDGVLKITYTLLAANQAYAGYTLAGLRFGKSGAPGATLSRWDDFQVRKAIS